MWCESPCWGLLNHWTAFLAALGKKEGREGRRGTPQTCPWFQRSLHSRQLPTHSHSVLLSSLQFTLSLSITSLPSVFHCWQHLCPVPVFPSQVQLFLVSIFSVSSWFSTISFSLPDLHSSQVPLIYPFLSHLCAQWSDFFVQLSPAFPIYLWTSLSAFLLFHIMSGSALFLSSSKLCHLFHSSFPNPFLPTDFQILLPSHYFTFPPPCPPSCTPYQHFFALWHQHPHQAVSDMVLEHIKEAQERVSPPILSTV